MGCGDFQGFEAEALNGGENVVGGFGPFERLWVGVDPVEISSDRGFQLGGGAVDAAADLLFGEVGEEALDLIFNLKSPRLREDRSRSEGRPTHQFATTHYGLT